MFKNKKPHHIPKNKGNTEANLWKVTCLGTLSDSDYLVINILAFSSCFGEFEKYWCTCCL